MDFDKWDWAMIIGLVLMLIMCVVLIWVAVATDDGSSGSSSDCFYMYSGTVATPVCT